ncbi:hypothetical protein BaOVIS_021040 [Babesia ovis]|uniref:Uncharacterized protein n=1 Tax=Babesia ovis TaxID=5869 RepID=A0A9W5TB29_BABOV|nr:hypothetical protein BaOVIS_021040 [Babesia ovis]
MAGIELLSKPPGRPVIDIRSNIANDLRQKAIAKRLDETHKRELHENRFTDASNRTGWSALKTSDLGSIPPRNHVYSRIEESVYNAKNTLKSLKVPDVDIEGARQEYIQRVGKDYSTVGLTSYLLAQKDAKEFRERCFHVLSWRAKSTPSEGGMFDTSDAPFFSNRDAPSGRARTPDDILLGSLGNHNTLTTFGAMDYMYSSPTNRDRVDAVTCNSPFATQAQLSESAQSVPSEERELGSGFKIGPMKGNEENNSCGFNFKRALGVSSQRSDAPVTWTPEAASTESQQNRLRVVEELLEEHRHIIPEDLDVKTLSYTEKRKLLRQLGFGDDYIANRLCDRYTVSQKRKNKKLTPLEAFSMYDRQDMNESMQVHKDLSLEFSRYVRSTEPPSVTTKDDAAPLDAFQILKARLQS